MKIAVISCSLNPKSRSRVLAREAEACLKRAGAELDFIDLQDLNLPFAGGKDSWTDPKVENLKARLDKAQGILMAGPIYTYDLNAAAKNVVELCGKSFENKVVAFICMAGGRASYMSVMAFASSLMLDFRSFIVPRFVYATKDAVNGDKIVDDEVRQRVDQLAVELLRVTRALKEIS